jgi:hypothetical protein
MVRVENDKLIIELNTPNGFAAEDLINIQKGIIEAVRCYNYADYPNPIYMFSLLDMLDETLPSVEDQKYIFNKPLNNG